MSKRADNGKRLLNFLYDQFTFVKNIVEVWITKVDKTASPFERWTAIRRQGSIKRKNSI